ncbi:CinA family protein [Porphyromonas sp. oral taxon 275]|uniref:CinA family protein n=1 Tax=Porphyromonas sp. oral taxon 275 TaxID=712435 RepID=UPI001BAC1B75|nr:CinA family protein [Porphyromonas sp. oral taxon 275]QUB42642.1 CinA family protein [Porphyromonas sp. oral taxon 275]
MGQESVLQRLREELERQQLTVATGESCTLGRVAASLGAPAGASGWLRGGILAYHPELKVSLLGVPERLIAERHVVSEEVARAMARGAAERLGADLGLGTTGLAGPTGADETHPVGMICLGAWLRRPKGSPREVSLCLHLDGDRTANIEAAVEAMHQLAYSLITSDTSDATIYY